MWSWIKTIFGGIGRIIKSAFRMITDYGKEVVINAPAVVIMTTSAMGITQLLTQHNVHAAITASWLNPQLTVFFISVSIVLLLSTISGKIAEVTS